MTKPGMKSEEEAWLLEHLYYEWSMLNYTINRIQVLPRGNEYNVNYESFAVHARLLSMFLTNGDTGNCAAKDFVSGGFRSRKPDKIIPLYNKIDPQVMHLAPKRPGEAERKFNSDECKILFDWLRIEFEKFFASLPSDVQEKWKAKAAGRRTVTVSGSSPGASSQVQEVTISLGKGTDNS